MQVETRTMDQRLWSRRQLQHGDLLPLVRFETPFERRRRIRRAVRDLLVLFAGAAALFLTITKGF